MKFTSKILTQPDAATLVIHRWDGVIRPAKFLRLSRNLAMVIISKHLGFSLIIPQDSKTQGLGSLGNLLTAINLFKNAFVEMTFLFG